MVPISRSEHCLTPSISYPFGRIAFLFALLLSLLMASTTAWSQPAPALRAVVPANAAPEAMAPLFGTLDAGEKRIAVPGASWLQLQFSDVQLGPKGVLTITGANGQSQSFTQTQIDSWGGLSATFNGAELRVALKGTAGAAPVSANVKEIIIGLPASAASATTGAAGTEAALPRGLRQLLGPDIRRFIPDDLRDLRNQGLLQQLEGGQESICGTTDDRVASSNVRVGRIMPIGCTGWQMLDNNPNTIAIETDGAQLYQLHNNRRIWRYTGVPCSGASCPGWQLLDNNPATVAIVADGGQLYQLHNNGRIWRHTGVPCSGVSCPGWQLLDNNGATVAISAGGGRLYQLHSTGRVWLFTGTPCSGSSCPGWQMFDNNPATGRLAAGAAGRLYQLHTTRTPMTRARICYECK